MATPAILLREWLDGSLSFLVSLVFHLFLLLFLALWVIPPQPTALITVRMAPHEQDVLLADLELDSPAPLETDALGDTLLEVAPEVFPDVADLEILEIELVDVDRPPTRSPFWLVEEDIDWFRQVTQAVGAASAGDADIVRDRPPADLRQRLQREGARGGEVQVSLAWNNVNDLDLHVICPSGEEISYRNMRSRCQGRLDVDMNVRGNRPWSERPVENTTTYRVRVPFGRQNERSPVRT